MLDLTKILPEGKIGTYSKLVQPADTRGNHVPWMNEFMGTPAYIDMVIRTAVDMVDKHLPEGYVSVGSSTEIHHIAPTSLGMNISVKLQLTEIRGEHLIFDVVFWDDVGETARGSHERMVVSVEKLQHKAQQRRRFLAERSFSNKPV